MEKNKEIKIDKMVLNIEGEKVSLTLEQAKKLKGVLDELFGKTEVIHHHDNYWWYRPYYYQSPLQPYCFQTAGVLAGQTTQNLCSIATAGNLLEVNI